jgi:hypothetical protein
MVDNFWKNQNKENKMRNLPKKPKPSQALIIESTKDYFGNGAPLNGLQRNIINVSLWIMQKRKGVVLNDEEKEAVWCIAQNLKDKVYYDTLNLKFGRDST